MGESFESLQAAGKYDRLLLPTIITCTARSLKAQRRTHGTVCQILSDACYLLTEGNEPWAKSMKRWWWLVIGFAVLCVIAGAVTVRAMYGGDTRVCGVNESYETFRAAGFSVDGLTVLDGCTYVVTGLRSGEVRWAVAAGNEEAVRNVLRSANVLIEDGQSPLHNHYILGDLFEDRESTLSERWKGGRRLSVYDEVEFRNRIWDREVTWSAEHDGDGYLLAVILETGSL